MSPSWTAGQTVQLLNSNEADLKYLLLAFTEAIPCFGWGPFPTLCWSLIPAELVNAKMQLAGVRNSPDFSPATFSPKLKESGEALPTTTKDKRDLLHMGTSEQGRAWGLRLRAAWVWGINSCLFVRKKSRKCWTSPRKPSTLLGWTNSCEKLFSFESRILQAA